MLVELPSRHRMRLASADPILGTSQALWPGIEIEHGGTAVMGPTSAPWVNTNIGFLRFARAATKAALWVSVRPPANTVFSAERYEQAIGDAALAGARWVLDFDRDLWKRLLAREPAALSDWKKVTGLLAYFEQHREWQAYQPFSTLAVSEDTDSGGLLSGSLLDMLSTMRTPVRVIPTHQLDRSRLDGIRVLLNVDPEAMSPAQKLDVDRFAHQGGTLVNPPPQWHFPVISPDQLVLDRKQAGQLQDLWELVYTGHPAEEFRRTPATISRVCSRRCWRRPTAGACSSTC